MQIKIIVYNIVIFTPSPIHCSLELDLFGFTSNEQTTINSNFLMP